MWIEENLTVEPLGFGEQLDTASEMSWATQTSKIGKTQGSFWRGGMNNSVFKKSLLTISTSLM